MPMQWSGGFAETSGRGSAVSTVNGPDQQECAYQLLLRNRKVERRMRDNGLRLYQANRSKQAELTPVTCVATPKRQ